MDWQDFGDISLLVVDDDHFTRELISMMLKKVAKVRIDEASSGEDALKILETKKHNIDMILLDYYMPGMNGKEFIHTIKKDNHYSDVPITLITTDRLNYSELDEVGANYYLTKPFNFGTFSSDIYSFLKQSK
jgi:CheY-like chemotaxis protein